MPEGTRRITLLQPGTSTRESGGDVVPGTPTEHVVYAVSRPRVGRIAEEASEIRGEWSTAFEILLYTGIENVDTEWRIRDDLGNDYRVESVIEISTPAAPARRVSLMAVRI